MPAKLYPKVWRQRVPYYMHLIFLLLFYGHLTEKNKSKIIRLQKKQLESAEYLREFNTQRSLVLRTVISTLIRLGRVRRPLPRGIFCSITL